MIINRVQQVEVMQRISVTDEEARRYYEAHKNELTTPSSSDGPRVPGGRSATTARR